MIDNTHFRPDQIEKIQEIGTRLWEARQARNLSLEAVATETRVSLRLLQAIETADVTQLPQAVYLKGLLVRYARAVGLNGDELARQLPDDDPLAGIAPTWQNVRFPRRRSFPFYFVYIVALVASISGASYWLQRNSAEVAQSEDARPAPAAVQPSSPAAKPQPTSPPKATPVANVQPPDTGKPVTVDMTLKDDCWLQVVADGKTTFEGTLQKGDRRKWEAKEELVIRAGNAGGVVIAYNDEQAKPLGQPGAVETVTYQAAEEEATQGG